MGMQSPDVGEPIDRFSDMFQEGERFYLEGIRVAHAKNTEFGEGDFVVLKVRGVQRELGIWGAYLVAQARSATHDDLHKWYTVTREVIEGFGKRGRAVKVLRPAPQVAAESFGDVMPEAEPEEPRF